MSKMVALNRAAGGRTTVEQPRPLVQAVLSVAPALALAVAGTSLAVGCASLSLNSLDGLRLVLLALLVASSVFLALHVRYEDNIWSREILLQVIAVIVAAGVLAMAPEYTYGYYINAIIHRSLYTAFILLGVGMWTTTTALYYVQGATPTARDRARFLMVSLPVAFAALAYGAILARIIQKGAPELSWTVLTQAYTVEFTTTVTRTGFVQSAGLRNHIEGTLLLMAMTGSIALPIGVGTGVFLSQYGGWFSHIVSICVSMLRSISVFILGVTAFSLVQYTRDNWSSATGTTPISDFIRGSYLIDGTYKNAAGGSFLLASVFLSLLVIPVIARATEEGCRSLPADIRDGSAALGATDGHLLSRMVLPWALPNIMTGLLLGLAEAAGSVAVLLFIAGSGEHGVGPLRGVTSLAFMVYQATPGRGPRNFTEIMSQYQFAAVFLLLVITFACTIAALLLRQRFAKRYRSGFLES